MLNRAVALAGVGVLSCAAHADVIERFVSPDYVVTRDEAKHTRQLIHLTGKPVYFCGLNAFASWSAKLTGQSADPKTLDQLLVRAGWIQPSTLDEDAQAAITERRGGWACASAQEPFVLMHSTVDPQILASVALNESAFDGRAWPWTLNVAGQGFFFANRADAYAAIEYLLAQKRCDFDVGIMQVNWCYHASRFASPWDALAPRTNIAVAEDILNENYQKTKSVAKAVAYYHSASFGPGSAYLSRFVAHLKQIQAGL